MCPSYKGVFLFIFACFELFIGVTNMDMHQEFPVFNMFLRDRRESEARLENSSVIDRDQRPSASARCNGTLANGTIGLFDCPKAGQTLDMKWCCGDPGAHTCCSGITTTEKTATTAKPEPEVDILTAVSISVSCAVAVTVCLTLYCCCCQRKQQESQPSRVKMMWIRRSFGKQLNSHDHVVGTHRTLLVSSKRNSPTEDQGSNETEKGDTDTLNLVKITITNPSNEQINADEPLLETRK